MFLLPIQYARFGETSLWSIPASLIVTPMTELLLWLLIPYLIAALIGSSPIVALTALPITAVSGLMRRVTSAISQTRALVSLSYPFTLPIMLVCIAALAIMAVKNVKNRLCALIPFGAAVSVFFCAVLIASRFSADRLYAVGSGSSDALVLVSDGECLVVDMSDGSSKLMRLTAARLGREQVTEIDTCMLTHLHRKHRNSLLSLCESRLVRRFLLPEPQTESETNALADIEELAAELGVTVALYPRPDPARIAFQSARVELCGYTRVKRSTHPVLQLTVCLDKDAPEARHAVYLGSAAAEFLPIPSAGFYLLGHHGPVPKAPLPPLDAPSAEPPELFLELIAAEKDGETVFPLPERPSGK